MPIEDFAGNVPPIGGGAGYRPPGLPSAYRPPEIVDLPAVIPGQVVQAPVQEFKPIPENMIGFFMLLLGL